MHAREFRDTNFSYQLVCAMPYRAWKITVTLCCAWIITVQVYSITKNYLNDRINFNFLVDNTFLSSHKDNTKRDGTNIKTDGQ